MSDTPTPQPDATSQESACEAVDKAEARERKLRSLFMGVCILLPVTWATVTTGVIHVVADPPPSLQIISNGPEATIYEPRSGSQVAKKFQIKGKLKEVPVGKTAWLVTQKEGLMWPKASLGDQAKGFQRSFHEGADKYYVELLLVDEVGETTISNWKEEAERTGKWPGIPEIPGAETVARIKLRR